MSKTSNPIAPEQFNEFGADYLPGLIGVNFTAAADGWMEAELEVRKAVMAPNGFLHAASVIALADSLCGYACVRSLPKGAQGFTTIELKTNFLGAARDGVIEARAEARHVGRTTQLWDATVKHRESGKTIAPFRCTQMMLWPK